MPVNSGELKNLILSQNIHSKSSVLHILQINLQNEASEKAIITTINSLLNSAKTKTKGLELLYLIIEHCSLSALEEYSVKWLELCAINPKGMDPLREMKFKVLAKIMEICHEIPGFGKKFASDYLSDTFKAIIATNTNNELKWAISCLIQCMKIHNSWFSNHKENTESFLFKILDYSDENIVREAAIAFLYYQQTGGAGTEGINHSDNFMAAYKKLCATVHFLYNTFFESINEIDDSTKVDSSSPIVFASFPSNFDSVQVLQATARRINNCLVFLKYMLVKKFPAKKQIVPKYLVDIVSRGLSIHFCLDKEVSLENSYLSILTTNIQINLFKLLRTAIAAFSINLLPFSFNITKSVLNSLKRTQTCHCFSTDSTYQEWAYKVCRSWLASSKYYLSINMQETLLNIISKDISSDGKAVQLKISIKNKKKNNKQSQENLQQPEEKKLFVIRNTVKKNVCLQALSTLNCLLKETVISVKPQIMANLYETIVSILLCLQRGTKLHPYIESDCQIELYKVLGAMFEQQEYFPPLHNVLHLLNSGVSNENHKISEVCSENLRILEKICQPVCPSLDILKQNKEITLQSDDLLNINESQEEENEILVEDEENELIIMNNANEENQKLAKTNGIKETDKINLQNEDEENLSIVVNVDSPIPPISEIDSDTKILKEIDEEIPINIEEDVIESIEEDILSGKMVYKGGENVVEISDDELDVIHCIDDESPIKKKEDEEENKVDEEISIEEISIEEIPDEEPPEKKQKVDNSEEGDILESFVDEIQDENC